MPETGAYQEVTSRDRRYRLWLAGIFIAALIIRLLHLFLIRDEAFFSVLLGDGQRYDEWAREIAAGDWIGQEVFYQAPLYPYFLGVVHAIFGDSLTAARIVQAVIGAGSCVLLADSGRRLFSRPVGLVAGVGLTMYAPAIFFDGLIQKSVLDLFFICLALWILARLHEDALRPGRWIGLGVVMGALVLTRENAMLLIPALLLWLAFRVTGAHRTRLVMAGAFALGLALVLLPVAVRNEVVGGEFHLTTSQFGPNFYIGNNERADGTYQPLRPGRGSPRYEQQDAKLMAEQAEGRELQPAEVSRFWTRRALDFITARPGAWLKLMATKAVLLGRAVELVDTESLESHADASLPLNLTRRVFHFGVLAPLAVLGMLLAWPRRREAWGLLLLILFYAAGLLLFYVVARYRYPLVPMLMLFAALGLVEVRAFCIRAPAVRILGAGVLVVLAALLSNWPGLLPGYTNLQARMRGVMESNLGTELLRRGDVDQAVEHLRRAVEADDQSVEFLVNLGRALYYQDDVEGCKDYLDRALQIDPGSSLARNQLGIYFDDQGKFDEAIEQYQLALQADPLNESVHLNLANSLYDQDKLEDAAAHYRQAIRLRPDYAQAHNYLGVCLIRLGRPDEGLESLETAVRIAPTDVDALYNLAVSLKNDNRYDEALGHLLRVVEIEPRHFQAHHMIGFIYGSQGRDREASEEFRKTLQIHPDNDESHFNLGIALNKIGQTKEALMHVREAVRLKPGQVPRMTYLAGMLATNPDERIRDPEAAIEIAEEAAELTQRGDATVLDTLAAAQAGAGRFEQAVATAQEAIDLAIQAGATAYADDIRSRQALYREGRPYIAPGG